MNLFTTTYLNDLFENVYSQVQFYLRQGPENIVVHINSLILEPLLETWACQYFTPMRRVKQTWWEKLMNKPVKYEPMPVNPQFLEEMKDEMFEGGYLFVEAYQIPFKVTEAPGVYVMREE